MQQMPSLFDERTIMKYDTSESLYGVGSFILVSMSIDITLALVGTLLSVLIMYALASMSWTYFPLVIGWSLLCFLFFDSFFGMVGAIASTAQNAQVIAIPFNSIFMMFSGFMISKASAPVYLQWVFSISPLSYAIQSIFVRMADDYGAEGKMVIKAYGFESGQDSKGIIIICVMIVVLRII